MESLSLPFILLTFLYIVLIHIIPKKYFIIFTLITSLLFYSLIDISNLFIVIAVIFINYLGSYFLSTLNNYRKEALIILVLLNLGFLVSIKTYINTDSSFLNNGNLSTKILFGMGCSFYILQSIGYLIDVYFDKSQFQKSITKLSLYICFFPQMILGPIERAKYLINEFENHAKPNVDIIKKGLSRISLGLIKKVIIANTAFSILVPLIEGHQYQNSMFLFSLLPLFMVCLYFDFSGYMDFSIGTAKMVGIKLNENFNNPLFSTGYLDFFNRWNISFTKWLREYVLIHIIYIFKKKRSFLIFLMIGLLSGLWHQTTLNFTIWGLLISQLLFLDYHYIRKIKSNFLKRLISIFLGSLTVPFFIFSELQDALGFFSSLFNNVFLRTEFIFPLNIRIFISFVFIFLVFVIESRGDRDLEKYLPKTTILKNVTMIFIFILIMIFLSNDNQINAYNRF